MNLDDRMKDYESSVGTKLILRNPAIIRIDGRAFHTFTRGFVKPFDVVLQSALNETMKQLFHKVSTANFGYAQSDEISLLLIDYKNLDTSQYFGGTVQKIVSVVASEATTIFNHEIFKLGDKVPENKLFRATFDARVFSIPERDVANYFIWRQKDCLRNSVLSKALAYFSPNQIKGKKNTETIEMLENLAKERNDLSIQWQQEKQGNKNGFIVSSAVGKKDAIIEDAPIFSENREIIEKYLVLVDEE